MAQDWWILGGTGAGVAYGAHIGGFVAGVVLAKPFMIWRKSSLLEAWRNQRRTNRMG
jgi:membrane associated rhomboid family serine protease